MVTFLLGWDKLVPDERRTKMQPFAEWQERLDKEFNRPTPVFQLAE
jgi:hypothetical protein